MRDLKEKNALKTRDCEECTPSLEVQEAHFPVRYQPLPLDPLDQHSREVAHQESTVRNYKMASIAPSRGLSHRRSSFGPEPDTIPERPAILRKMRRGPDTIMDEFNDETTTRISAQASAGNPPSRSEPLSDLIPLPRCEAIEGVREVEPEEPATRFWLRLRPGH